MSSGNFQNQVLEHLSTQIGKGNFKTSQSVTNELEKQQSRLVIKTLYNKKS